MGELLLNAGFVLDVYGVILGFAGRLRRALWVLLASNALSAAAEFAFHSWLLFAGNVASVIVCALLLWWQRRRRDRAPRSYGAKSRALIAALVRKTREAARPRPVLRPVPQGSN